MEFKLDEQARGTRILFGETAAKRRSVIASCTEAATRRGLH